jgi:hypothetical protein
LVTAQSQFFAIIEHHNVMAVEPGLNLADAGGHSSETVNAKKIMWVELALREAD